MSLAGGAHPLLIGLAAVLLACGGLRPAPAMPTGGPAAAAAQRVSQPVGSQEGTASGGRITGRMIAPDGRPLLNGAVMLLNLDGETPIAGPTGPITIRPDGTFEFRDVLPGRYEIRARGETEADSTLLFGAYRIIMDGRDLTGVQVKLVPGATLTGTVIVERVQGSRPPPRFAGLIVRSPLADGSSLADAITGQPASDGGFSIRGLMPGSHTIRIDGLEDPWVLKSVTIRGRDITDTALDAESHAHVRGVRVTITDVATEVSGMVRDTEGRARAEAAVLIVPRSPQFWSRTSRRLALRHTDSAGRYRIRGLPAGEYRAIAATALDEIEAFGRDLLERAAATGVPFTLEPLEIRVLDVPLTVVEPSGLAREPRP